MQLLENVQTSFLSKHFCLESRISWIPTDQFADLKY